MSTAANDNLPGTVTATTTDTFDADTASGVVLVDFWAEWCTPCQMMLPRLAASAERLAGRAKIMKLNVDEHPHVAQNFRVMSIPTMIVFKDGKAVDKMVGTQTVDDVVAKLESYLGTDAAAA